MARENFANFATTQLAFPSPLSTTALSFTVTNGTGAAFPVGNFVVNMDTEMLFIISRSFDTFIVAPRGRGFDNTPASQHLAGSTVQLSICAYNLLHLWSNVVDGYHPEVPPAHLFAGTGLQPASSYDNEFEAVGSWTLYPSPPPSGVTFGLNTPLSSHLVVNRWTGSGYDNGLYTAYVPFPLTTPFTITTKISESVNVPQNGTAEVTEVHLFVSDQASPISSGDSGNRFRVDTRTQTAQTSITQDGTTGSILSSQSRQVRCAYNRNGIWTQLNPLAPYPIGIPVYLRIIYDGAGNWTGLFGDGYTYTLLVYFQNFAFAPQSMGLQFYVKPVGNFTVQQTVAVDFVRVATVSLPPYGS